MKLKRLKEEYINVRKDLYVRVEENNKLQHDLVASRMKNDYYAQLNNQTLESIRSVGSHRHRSTNLHFFHLFKSTESEQTTAIQLYLKEKAENQHCQLKCRAYQQKLEQLQKSYEVLKDKYKERVQEERFDQHSDGLRLNSTRNLSLFREVFERAKRKYLDHIKNVQHDLHETRKLLEKDAELKMNQETAYQQLIDERRQLLTR